MTDRFDFVIYGASGYTGYYCVKVNYSTNFIYFISFYIEFFFNDESSSMIHYKMTVDDSWCYLSF